MGSRRGRHAALVAAVAGLGACSVGAPPGFSAGESWTAPLVGPLENGLLLVPAQVAGKGPFLFALDPDANVSAVDEDVVKACGLRTGVGPHLLDESDTEQPAIYAEVLDWKLGTLAIHRTSNASAVVVKNGTYDSEGRRIHGLIGRDIIADSLVFGFDRDQGVMTLATAKAFTPPAGATTIGYDPLVSRIQNVDVVPVPRRLVKATVDGRAATVHLDLGHTASQLRQPPAQPAAVVLGSLHVDHVPFIRYSDQRWESHDLDGTLGLTFFRDYNVNASWDKTTYYVRPRAAATTTAAARIGRWQSPAFTACKNPGCATVSLTDPLAGKPAAEQPAQHPGVVVSVAREAPAAQMDLEVVIAVTPAQGKPALQWLVAELPKGTDRVITHLPADYVGATLAVVDASPFPRACPADGGCVDKIAAPQ